jgi:hypothetical protein
MLKTLLGGVNAVWRGEAAVYDRTGTKLSSLRCTDCRHVPGGSRCRKQWITSTNGASARRRYARRPKALLRDRQERRCWTLLRPMNEWLMISKAGSSKGRMRTRNRNRGRTGRDLERPPPGRFARHQQPRDEGVLSGAVDVRPDRLRRLRAASLPSTGHPRTRAGMGRRTCSTMDTPSARATEGTHLHQRS